MNHFVACRVLKVTNCLNLPGALPDPERKSYVTGTPSMPGKLGQLIALEEPQLQAVEESGDWNTEHSIMRGKLHSRIGRFKAALCKEAGGCGGKGV